MADWMQHLCQAVSKGVSVSRHLPPKSHPEAHTGTEQSGGAQRQSPEVEAT